MGSNTGIPMSNFNSLISSPKHVIVGDGFFLPITAASHTTLLHIIYHLTNTHIAPKITKISSLSVSLPVITRVLFNLTRLIFL